MLRFDTFVFREPDGKLRLLFEEGGSYLYVWINTGFEILAFQYLIDGFIGLHYHETGAIEIKSVSREPFNRALTGATDLSVDAALEQLSRCTSREFPALVELLVALARRQITKAIVPKKSRRYILNHLKGDSNGL